MRRFDELTREEQVEAVKNCERLYERLSGYCTGLFSPAYCNVDELLYKFPESGYYEINGAWGGRIDLGTNLVEIADYLEEVKGYGEIDAMIYENGFGHYDIDDENQLLAKFRKYAEVLREDDNGYIDCGHKNREYMTNFCFDIVGKFEKHLLETCKAEYEYFEDIGNCIEVCEEMEYFDTDNIYVTDDLKIIDLEEIQDVLRDNNYALDISTIAHILEEVGERINA